jgi:hypothetical protein
VENLQAYDTNPLFAILHESIYCQGFAARWSAARIRREFPEFELRPGAPVYFTGEMIYPWMFDEYRHLRPLRVAADLLAEDASWPTLYDPAVLRANTVPVAAAIYYDDMYVDRDFSVQTAAAIRGSKVWITNEYAHNALRADGEVVFGRLLEMACGQRWPAVWAENISGTGHSVSRCRHMISVGDIGGNLNLNYARANDLSGVKL